MISTPSSIGSLSICHRKLLQGNRKSDQKVNMEIDQMLALISRGKQNATHVWKSLGLLWWLLRECQAKPVNKDSLLWQHFHLRKVQWSVGRSVGVKNRRRRRSGDGRAAAGRAAIRAVSGATSWACINTRAGYRLFLIEYSARFFNNIQ